MFVGSSWVLFVVVVGEGTMCEKNEKNMPLQSGVGGIEKPL